MKQLIFNLCSPIIALLLLCCSCNTEEELKVTHTSQSPIERMLYEFRAKTTPASRSLDPLKIMSVDTKYYTAFSNDSVIETFTTRTGEDGLFDISTVIIDTGKTSGFAILSTHPKINRIFYYTENGHINDTTLITPLKMLIDNVPYYAYKDYISTDSQNPTTRSINKVDPIVPYQWMQGYPFNLFTPACNCSQCTDPDFGCNGHQPIGCVALAVAEAIATIGVFPGTFYGNKNIQFSTLPAMAWEMNDDTRLVVARFLHEIALNCQMQFGCGGSGTGLKAAYHYLLDIGYNCQYQEDAILPGRVLVELTNGLPHIISAKVKNKQGHAWLIDGIIVENGKFQYHFNWGYNGKFDGWSYGDTFQSKDDLGHESDKYDTNFKHIYMISKPS